jgi:inosine-uridine nucleoside N-ribohydrolase
MGRALFPSLHGSVGYQRATSLGSQLQSARERLRPSDSRRVAKASAGAGICRRISDQTGARLPPSISIFAGGPLTDIALAVRADSEFVGLVKELLFFGGARTLSQPDLNFRFDPEAAQIVMGANWQNIILVCDVTYGKNIKLEHSDLARIGAGSTPIGDYVFNFSYDDVGTNNLWDEICAAILIDRSLITESRDAYLDVVVDPQKVDYGAVKVSFQNALIDGQSSADSNSI